MSTIAYNKQRLRQKLREHSAAVDEKKKRLWSRRISAHIVKTDMYQKAHTVALYIPHAGEPDIWPVIRDAWKEQKTVLIPRIEGKQLVLRSISCEKDLEIGPYRIRQPKAGQPKVSSFSVELFFVPGLAFDTQGFRLGHGEGYYDRLLKHIQKPTIGMCYGFQLLDELPHDIHDMKVDGIMTEKEYIDTMNLNH